MKCINCNKELEQIKGKKAKIYCSDKCRITFKRSNPNTLKANKSNPNSDISNPNIKSEQMTDSSRIGKVIKGYCHGCGRDIKTIKEQWVNPEKATQEDADRICICLPCIKKGITHEKLGLKC